MSLPAPILWLFVLALPVACIAWTVTHEEIFAEPRAYCVRGSKERKSLLARKFFYVFTCEYCFSFYVSIFVLAITRYKLLYDDWRGYLLGVFALMWIANAYMSLFFLLRTGIKKEGMEIKKDEKLLNRSEKTTNQRNPDFKKPYNNRQNDDYGAKKPV